MVNTHMGEGSGKTYFSKQADKDISTRVDYIIIRRCDKTLIREVTEETELGWIIQGNNGFT